MAYPSPHRSNFAEDSEAQIDRELGLKAGLNRFSLLSCRLQMLNVQI